jgi:hypothetical protein
MKNCLVLNLNFFNREIVQKMSHTNVIERKYANNATITAIESIYANNATVTSIYLRHNSIDDYGAKSQKHSK